MYRTVFLNMDKLSRELMIAFACRGDVDIYGVADDDQFYWHKMSLEKEIRQTEKTLPVLGVPPVSFRSLKDDSFEIGGHDVRLFKNKTLYDIPYREEKINTVVVGLETADYQREDLNFMMQNGVQRILIAVNDAQEIHFYEAPTLKRHSVKSVRFSMKSARALRSCLPMEQDMRDRVVLNGNSSTAIHFMKNSARKEDYRIFDWRNYTRRKENGVFVYVPDKTNTDYTLPPDTLNQKRLTKQMPDFYFVDMVRRSSAEINVFLQICSNLHFNGYIFLNTKGMPEQRNLIYTKDGVQLKTPSAKELEKSELFKQVQNSVRENFAYDYRLLYEQLNRQEKV